MRTTIISTNMPGQVGMLQCGSITTLTRVTGAGPHCLLALNQRLVYQPLKCLLIVIVRPDLLSASAQHLREAKPHQLFAGIGEIGCGSSAAPTVDSLGANTRFGIFAVINRGTETEVKTSSQHGDSHVAGMIGDHQVHCFSAENTFTVEFAAVQQHLTKASVIGDGSQHPSCVTTYAKVNSGSNVFFAATGPECVKSRSDGII